MHTAFPRTLPEGQTITFYDSVTSLGSKFVKPPWQRMIPESFDPIAHLEAAKQIPFPSLAPGKVSPRSCAYKS